MKRLVLAAIATAAFIQPTEAETRFEAGRRVYVMMKAGTEYCQQIEPTMNGLLLIEEAYRYDPAADGEYQRVQTDKQKLFSTFQGIPRALVCEMLMQEFGPGGRLHLFQFR